MCELGTNIPRYPMVQPCKYSPCLCLLKLTKHPISTERRHPQTRPPNPFYTPYQHLTPSCGYL